jgi:hypothetical protein
MWSDDLECLADILQMSVNKNGEIPLTNRHLLRIVKMTRRKIQERHDESLEEDNYPF